MSSVVVQEKASGGRIGTDVDDDVKEVREKWRMRGRSGLKGVSQRRCVLSRASRSRPTANGLAEGRASPHHHKTDPTAK